MKLTVLAAAMTVFSGVAVAATDGTLGLTSTGESIVTIIKENAVQITDVDDINLGTQATLAADATGSDDVCIFSSTGAYTVTASSANTVLELQDGANSIPYALEWDGNALSLGTATPLAPADSSSLTCAGSGGTNASFGVTVASADFNAAAPGTYTDTLTFVVSPL